MSSITSDIPREIEDILVDIKYIAGLPPGHKYDIASKGYVSATAVTSRVYRTGKSLFVINDDKIVALNFINRTIGAAVTIAKKWPKWQQLICSEIALMSEAIINLKHVYANKPGFTARLSTVEIKIQPDAFQNACNATPAINIPAGAVQRTGVESNFYTPPSLAIFIERAMLDPDWKEAPPDEHSDGQQ